MTFSLGLLLALGGLGLGDSLAPGGLDGELGADGEALGGSAGGLGCGFASAGFHVARHCVPRREEGQVGGVDGGEEFLRAAGEAEGHLGREVGPQEQRVADEPVAGGCGADVVLLGAGVGGEVAVFGVGGGHAFAAPRRGGAAAFAAVHAAAAVGHRGGAARAAGGAGLGAAAGGEVGVASGVAVAERSGRRAWGWFGRGGWFGGGRGHSAASGSGSAGVRRRRTSRV